MIPVAALALLKKPKALMIGLAVVAVAIVVLVLKLQIAGLERDVARRDATIERQAADLQIARANVATAVAVNDRNLVELDRFKTDSTALRTAFAGELQRIQARCAGAAKTQEAIARAKQENPATCPVANSVAAAVDGLRELIAGSADRDEDRARGDPPAR